VKRSLIYLVAFVFLLTASIALAGEAAKTATGGCPMMQGKQIADSSKVCKPSAGCCPGMGKAAVKVTGISGTAEDGKATAECPMHAKMADKAEAPKGEVGSAAEVKETAVSATATTASSTPKIGETCPDVSSKTALSNFHEVMSPMHVAFEGNKYDEMKGYMPKLVEVSKGIASYKCPMSDKCSPDCMKKFDEKKVALLKGVDELDLAFKGTDNKKIDTAFTTMHQAFVEFAGMCSPKVEDTKVKVEETKVEETK
jgi:hypothetical protein